MSLRRFCKGLLRITLKVEDPISLNEVKMIN